MKITWEPSDIKCGRRVRKPGAGEVWMIGYNPSLSSRDHFCLVSLADGMISTNKRTAEELAADLNERQSHPIELTSEAGNG